MENQEEVALTVPPQEMAIIPYAKASELKLSDEEEKKLDEPIDSKLIEIRPDGMLYFPQVFYREKLNKAFGRGQWAMVEHQVLIPAGSNKLFYDGSLYIRGYFVARATGEADYHENNPLQSWASVKESGKSDCLVRCCKDLSIAKELWQPQFTQEWVKQNAVKVWREKTGKQRNGEIGSFQWRKKTAEKFWDEKNGNNDKSPQDGAAKKSEEQKQKGESKKDLDAATVAFNFISQQIKEAKDKDALRILYDKMKSDDRLTTLQKEELAKKCTNRKNELTSKKEPK